MEARLSLLSIVCPAYQEEDVLPLFHRELCAVLTQLDHEFAIEIVYVDDGSRDRTLPVLKQLAAQDPRIVFLSLSRNFGHQAALSAGLEHCRGDVVISMDSDLQHPPGVIPVLLDEWREGFDVVLTIRAEDSRLPWTKRLTSNVFYRVMGAALSETDIRLAASDFRLMTRRALDGLLQLKERHRFLRGMVQWLGFPSTEVHFRPEQRRAGTTKYTFRRMLKLAGDGLFSFSSAPMRLAFYLGALTLVAGAGFGLWSLIGVITGHGFSTGDYLVLITHFLGGAILCCLGILGEYVGRIFEQVKERPIYVLKENSRAEQSTVNQETPPGRREAA